MIFAKLSYHDLFPLDAVTSWTTAVDKLWTRSANSPKMSSFSFPDNKLEGTFSRDILFIMLWCFWMTKEKQLRLLCLQLARQRKLLSPFGCLIWVSVFLFYFCLLFSLFIRFFNSILPDSIFLPFSNDSENCTRTDNCTPEIVGELLFKLIRI